MLLTAKKPASQPKIPVRGAVPVRKKGGGVVRTIPSLKIRLKTNHR